MVFWKRHRIAVLGMGISVLLHILLFAGACLWISKPEKRTFRVQIMPTRTLRPSAFRVPKLRLVGPEGKMEMLRREGGPAFLPEIAPPSVAALGEMWDDIERMLMPEADILSFLLLGAKPAEFAIAHPEMIPTAELGAPRDEPINLRRDLLTLEDLDRSGRFKAMVVIDPKKKRNTRGYVHIPQQSAFWRGELWKQVFVLIRFLVDLGSSMW